MYAENLYTNAFSSTYTSCVAHAYLHHACMILSRVAEGKKKNITKERKKYMYTYTYIYTYAYIDTYIHTYTHAHPQKKASTPHAEQPAKKHKSNEDHDSETESHASSTPQQAAASTSIGPELPPHLRGQTSVSGGVDDSAHKDHESRASPALAGLLQSRYMACMCVYVCVCVYIYIYIYIYI